jgi:hypothetical protein
VIRRRALLGSIALAIASTGLTGCRSVIGVDVSLNRSGQGDVTVTARLDQEAQRYLSRDGVDLTKVTTADGNKIADALAPWATLRQGWSAPGSSETSIGISRDASGTVVLSTTQPVISARALKGLMDTTQTTLPLLKAGDRPTDLPANIPLLNDFTFSLQPDGSNSDFNMFGRAGVGALDAKTCGRDDLATSTGLADATLRRDLSFVYRFTFPEPPRRSSAQEIRDTQAIWTFKYGDCPRLSAGSNRGSSSRVLNGAILAGAAAFLALILAFRAFRRRRERRSSNNLGQSEG